MDKEKQRKKLSRLANGIYISSDRARTGSQAGRLEWEAGMIPERSP